MTGLVKWFKNDEGYGFLAVNEEIKREHGIAVDLYVHGKEVRFLDRPLYPDDVVEFDIGRGRDHRPIATNVRLKKRADRQEPAIHVRD